MRNAQFFTLEKSILQVFLWGKEVDSLTRYMFAKLEENIPYAVFSCPSRNQMR